MIGAIRLVFLASLTLVVVAATAQADVVILKDGGRLRCEVLEDNEEDGFLRIRIGGGVLRLRKEIVSRIEYLPDDRPRVTSQDQDLLQRLIEAGDAFASGEDEAAPGEGAATQEADPLIVKAVRGWAYVGPPGRRVSLQEGDRIPLNQVIQVSPNSRLTLEIRETGLVGLTSGAEVRFDRIQWDRTIQLYTIDVRLLHGMVWFKIGTDADSWRRVRLSVNAVYSVLQEATLTARAGVRSGEAFLTYLAGRHPQQNFQRQTDSPASVRIGQRLHVNPGSQTLGVQDSQEVEQLQRLVQDWDNWSPEPLHVTLTRIIPPLDKYSLFGVLPALHPHHIPIDEALAYPAEDRSLGEILNAYKEALNRYRTDTGRYPPREAGLDALVRPMGIPGWRGPYIDKSLPRKDPWGSDFVYELFDDDGRTIVGVRSLGPNRRDDYGLGDDIR